jgi:hypothetical protein
VIRGSKNGCWTWVLEGVQLSMIVIKSLSSCMIEHVQADIRARLFDYSRHWIWTSTPLELTFTPAVMR